jgi:hypothetical protein
LSFTPQEAVKVLGQKFLLQEGIAGISHHSQQLIVYVETPEAASKIPQTLMGFPVKTIISGKFKTLALPPAKTGKTLTGTLVDRTMRLRPIVGGISTASIHVTAGTLTGRVIDKTTGLKMLLSNYHVFYGNKDTPILQPGPYDNGVYPDDVVGYVERYIEVKPPPDINLIDACIAQPVSQDIIADEVLDIGVVNGVEEARVGMRIRKSGRSCGVAEALIQDTAATVKVDGYSFGEAIFEDTIISTFVGLAGDSGSIAVSADTNAAVALLFAGSDTLTCFNKMTNVVKLLNVDIPSVAVGPSIRAPAMSYVQFPITLGLALVMCQKA